MNGSVVARPDSFAEVLRLSLEHVHRSRLEPGCASHDVHVDAENPLRLVFLEQWSDAAALRAHFTVPGSLAFAAAVTELAATPPTLMVWDASPTRV